MGYKTIREVTRYTTVAKSKQVIVVDRLERALGECFDRCPACRIGRLISQHPTVRQ